MVIPQQPMVEDSQGSGKGGGASEEDQGRSTDAGDDEGDDDGSMGERECRICHSCDDSGEGWISPCRYVRQSFSHRGKFCCRI